MSNADWLKIMQAASVANSKYVRGMSPRAESILLNAAQIASSEAKAVFTRILSLKTVRCGEV